MNTVKGSTVSETRMIRGIQAAIGVAQDGLIGPVTMSSIAGKLGARCWPCTLKLQGMPVIIAKDIIVSNPKAGCGSFKNSLSGSFSYNRQPCSILVNQGKVICGSACHAWLGKPETVLCRMRSGELTTYRCRSAEELPEDTVWAVGGVGLLGMYDPAREGFCRQTYLGGVYDYSDVLRKTNHTVLGVKDGLCWLVYCKSMTGAQVNAFVRDKLCLEMAVMLDGGHVAAINGEESFARINTKQVQYYMIQAL